MKLANRPGGPTRRQLAYAGFAALAAAAVPAGLCLARKDSPERRISEKALTHTTATIALGDPRGSYLGPKGSSIDHQPVGIDFHEHDWPFDQLGTVRYAQGPYSFALRFVSGVMGTYSRKDPERGIYAWSITAFPMAGETIAHEYARDDLFRLFARLLKAGWRRYIRPGTPRLAGPQTMRYFIEKKGNYSPDPAYVPILDEWMQLNRKLPSWLF